LYYYFFWFFAFLIFTTEYIKKPNFYCNFPIINQNVKAAIAQGWFLFAGSYLFALAPYEKENFENIQKILFFFIRFWW
jgi:hypothetical protein